MLSRLTRGAGCCIALPVAAMWTGAACPALAQVINEDFKMLSNDGAAGDWFAWTVRIDNGIVVIGANRDDDNGSASGSAYLFDLSTGAQIDKLLPDDGVFDDNFGWSADIADGRVAVGAPLDGDKGFRAGSAYLFDASTGMQTHKLLGSDSKAEDKFGYCIAMKDGIVAVGAPYDTGSGPGRAYLFDASNGNQLHKLVPEDGLAGDQFGISIAIDNGVVAIGAYLSDDNGSFSGSAYLFDASTGAQLHKLLPDDGAAGDYFGWSIAINDGVVAVGARTDDDHGTDSGSVYLFDAPTGAQLDKLLADDGTTDDQFGTSVSMQNGLVSIGSKLDGDNGGSSGSAYVFNVSTGAQIVKLLASDGAALDVLGHAIAIENGVVVVGAINDDDNGTDSGSAYVFNLDSTGNCIGLAVSNFVAGQQATWTVDDVTPGVRAAVVYGFQNGVTNVNNVGGYCASFDIQGVNQSRLLGQPMANGSGVATLTKNIPNGTAGIQVLMQAAEQGACPGECMSNLLVQTIG